MAQRGAPPTPHQHARGWPIPGQEGPHPLREGRLQPEPGGQHEDPESGAGAVIRIPQNEKLKKRLREFEEQLGEWNDAVKSLRGAQPGLVWGMGVETAVAQGQQWLRRRTALREKGQELLDISPLWSWSELGEGLSGLAGLARDLQAREEAMLGFLASTHNPAAVLSRLGLGEGWKEVGDADLEDLNRKLQRRARLLCPWTLGLGEEGELRH